MNGPKTQIVLSAQEYFVEIVETSSRQRKMAFSALAKNYLVELLSSYISTEKLYDIEDSNGVRKQLTLAEMLLRAANTESSARNDLLKRLGDVSLYVSGFFGDSLNRKVVDIDYYAQMGSLAYASLARAQRDQAFSQLYLEYSERFLDFVELLTFISQKSLVQTDENLLRLYDRFLKTGSELAKETLLEKGLIPQTGSIKAFKQ